MAPSLLFVADTGSPLVGGTTLGLLLSGGLLIAAIRRYPVMAGFPKSDYVARARVVKPMLALEVLVVLDWDDHVRNTSETAAELHSGSTERMIGEPV